MGAKLKTFLSHSFVLYICVGVANTCVGFGCALLLTYFGVLVELSQTIGTIFGVLNSYVLNKKFTFKSQNSHKQDFVRFIIAMGIAYGASMLVLGITHRILNINEYIALIYAQVAYTLVGYVVSRFWAFKPEVRQ
ncbi:GtrA family protein [uncultured Helicobacter sp.]|uniref:GtrA family protein n=1 Tax=uncultured Helicobacter sp. TaxID=175537 RepID=UPI001C3AD5DF|nr:GtrA family protein [Candidatus Helicobacter avicola]